MYQIYFGELLFPVAPEQLEVQHKNQNSGLSLLNEGELNLLKSPGLTAYTLKLLLPGAPYHFGVYAGGFQPPSYFTAAVERLKTQKQVFDFTVLNAQGGKHIHAKTTVEGYSLREQAGTKGDVLLSITLKQYVHYATKILTITNGTGNEQGGRPPSTQPPQKTYTIVDGDSLWSIARKVYADGMRFQELYLANKQVLDAEAARRGMGAEMGERWIFTGTVITIP